MTATDVLLMSSSPPRQFKHYSLVSSSPQIDEAGFRGQMQGPQCTNAQSQASHTAITGFVSASTLFKLSPKDADIESIRAPTKETVMDREASLSAVTEVVKSTLASTTPLDIIADGGVAIRRENIIKESAGKDTMLQLEKKPRKPRAKKSGVTGTDGKQSARKPRAKAAKKSTDGSIEQVEKQTRKIKATVAVDKDPQTKLSKGRVTKASSKVAKPKGDAFEGETVAPNRRPRKPKKSETPTEEILDFGLDEAVKRRVNWTPPSKSVPDSTFSVDSSTISLEKKGFGDLFGEFALVKADVPARKLPTLLAKDARKRKLIELVTTSGSTSSGPPSAAKVKIVKKARTITELATSVYAQNEEESAPQGQLLQYFAVEESENVANVKANGHSKPKPRSKASTTTTKSVVRESTLLSPQSALRTAVDQDFVFGTSSQLAREESPTLLRDLQAAMQASNEIDDPFAELLEDSREHDTQQQPDSDKSKSLWAASAGDITATARKDDGGQDILDTIITNVIVASPTNPVPVPESSTALGPIEAAIRSELLNCPQRASVAKESSPRRKVASKPDRLSKLPAKSQQSAAPQMPKYEAYTTGQLAKEIASYRFKPIKSRARMILLLERCWEGKHRPALGILGTNMTTKPITSPSQKDPHAAQPRGRPRKAGPSDLSPRTKAKVKELPKPDEIDDLDPDSDTPLSQIRTPKKNQLQKPPEDISDTEAEHKPSPRRSKGKGSKVSPLALRQREVLNNDSIFIQITQAVKAAPRSTDPLHPSWHEKILLYDPIVLEDLTAWLNTGALQNVGCDDEVEPKEVKRWCESKSICCLWRENLTGGARSRY